MFVGVKESDGTYTAKRRSVESGMETSYLSEISGDVEAGEKVLFPTEGLLCHSPKWVVVVSVSLRK